MGTHPVPYDFGPFLDALGDDWSQDDLLWAWLGRSDLDADTRRWVREWGRRAATVYGDVADFVERPENLPRLVGKGPFDNEPQEVILPGETWEVLGEVHASGIWDPDLDDRARYAAVYLLNQNGEMGILCSVACTDGLQRLLRRFAADDERNGAVLAVLDGQEEDDWIHGAQFVTEIQGGSDAAANAVRAEGPDDEGLFTLRGQKWFCSNLTADYWLVTARHSETGDKHRGIGVFCVPRDQAGYTIERLKEKLGTRALPTAEISLHGAQGWPVGPLDQGLKNVVATVLTASRIHNMLACAAFLRRASREAAAYASFRDAFGMRLVEMPLVAASLAHIEQEADLTCAGVFATVDAWLAAQREGASDDERLWARFLISLAKAVTARRAPGIVYEAMMVMGGNGIEERFTALPRLYRDAAILETWEGPYTLLLMQALSDLRRFGVAGRETAFLAAGLGRDDPDLARELADVLAADEDDGARAWGTLAPTLYRAFEEHALAALPAQA